MHSYTCNVCGYVTESEDEAKFCQQCGSRFGDAVTPPAPSPVHSTSQAGSRAKPKSVVGPIIQENLLARLEDNGEIKSGRLEVRHDGILFVTSTRFGNKLVQVPAENIARVEVIEKPGGFSFSAGKVILHVKSGYDVTLVMSNPHKWATMIRKQMVA